MDKLTIVMSNYIDVECDANTTPRQAYERGFRRAAEKCETVMRSRKAKNDALESENAKLRELVLSLYESALICCGECWLSVPHSPAMCGNDNCGLRQKYLAMQELGIEFKGDE